MTPCNGVLASIHSSMQCVRYGFACLCMHACTHATSTRACLHVIVCAYKYSLIPTNAIAAAAVTAAAAAAAYAAAAAAVWLCPAVAIAWNKEHRHRLP
eukprot:6178361-Pleurochrysis_carterae.AAC.4